MLPFNFKDKKMDSAIYDPQSVHLSLTSVERKVGLELGPISSVTKIICYPGRVESIPA